MAAADLWAAVVSSYDADGLVSLTNFRDRSGTTVNTATGESAAQGVIDVWPLYAQTDYDDDNPQHVEIGKFAVIAILWRRGGTSSSIAKVEWDEVFGAEGMVARVKMTGARGRPGPVSNSGVQQRSELVNGRAVRGWSDVDSLPTGILPLRRTAGHD